MLDNMIYIVAYILLSMGPLNKVKGVKFFDGSDETTAKTNRQLE